MDNWKYLYKYLNKNMLNSIKRQNKISFPSCKHTFQCDIENKMTMAII